MDKNHLTTEIHTTNNINCPSSSITLTIPNKTYLNEHVSKNILSDLSPLCNLKETDENELPFPGFVEKVFYCLKQTITPRYQCLQLITWPWFERISMFIILLNCITLGMYQPCEHHSNIQGSKNCDTTRCFWLQVIDHFIFAFFTIEMCIKMIAMGIFGKGSYLADTWNRLDCFIVVSGLIESIMPGDNLSLSAIRTIRVLRPLRAINRVPSMRILVMLLLDTFPMLGNVLLLCFFVFSVFGIIGVQLWKGLLRNRCFLQLNITNISDYALFENFQLPTFYIPHDQDSFVCSHPQSSGMTKCSDIPKLRIGNMTCELDLYTFSEQLSKNSNKLIHGCINWNKYYTFCNVSDRNPYSNSISFDNVGLAWIAIFQVISQESWVNIMYYIQDVHSFWAWIYFVCLILIGSFFLINLCLVVIATQFSETKKRETERMLNERKRYKRSSSTLLIDEHNSCWTHTIIYLEYLWKYIYERIHISWKNYRQKHTSVNKKCLIEIKKHRQKEILNNNQTIIEIHQNRNSTVNSSSFLNFDVIHRPHCQYHQLTDSSFVHTSSSLCPSIVDTSVVNPERSDIVDLIHIENVAIENETVPSIFYHKKIIKPDHLELETIDKNQCDCDYQNFIPDKLSINIESEEEDNDNEEENKIKQKSKISQFCNQYICPCLLNCQKSIATFVASNYYNHIILSAILINMLVMGVEYHGQPQSLTNALEFCNLIFALLYIIEMILKIIADGYLQYIKNIYNLFDSIIVIISIIELQGHTNSGLSVLRTFRLLRVLKLVRFMPTLRRQLILTQEDWHGVLYNGMKNTNAWAALYFIALMTFGNYVLFNLLVAILVEGFSTEKESDISDVGSMTSRLEKIDPFTTQALFTGDVEQLPHPHELIIDESTSNNQEHKTSQTKDIKVISSNLNINFLLEVKKMSMSKMVISNQHDSNVRLTENHLKTNTNINSNSSLSTILSFHTCIDSMRTESLSFQRRHTISSIRNNSVNNLSKTQDNILENNSLTLVYDNNHRIYNNKRRKCLLIHEDKFIEQEINNSNMIRERQSPIDNFTYPIKPIETSKHDCNSYLSNSIEIDVDKDSNIIAATTTATIINNQDDIEIDATQSENQSQSGICQICLTCLCENQLCKYFEKRQNYSLYIFSPENRFRQIFKCLMIKKSFDHLILIFIALNCITLAMERPSLSAISFERHFLNITNIIFTIIFTIEMMIKVIANGFICGRNTYLHNRWNAMDGLLVIISIIDLATMYRGTVVTSSNLESEAATRIFSMLKVFRLLRTLRPLRVVNRAPGLKLVLQTLISSLKPIGHIVIICCTFFIIFGILGVQLFKGKFYYCEGSFAYNVTTRQQCEEMPDHRWKNQQYNFDNLGQALLCLFILSSRDGWVQMMYNGIDAVDVDMQPIRNYNVAKLLYFISFLLLVGFFVLNMFVGVVVENFHKCRVEQEREEKLIYMTKCAVELARRRRRREHELPYYVHFAPWRRRLYHICNSKYFDLSIAIIIALNVITMSLEFYLMPPVFEIALDYCNYIFTIVFIIEAILKIIALGPLNYFKDKWNQIDSIIVILSISGIVIEKMKNGHMLPINPTIIRVMRVLRIARVLKLLKMAKGVQALLNTVIEALPQVGNLSLLFFLLFFIYAAIGVELFGKLECTDERPCVGLSKHAHFKNFGMSFLTLFRIATGDNWNGIMKDALRPDHPTHRGKNHFMSVVAPIYFVTFVLMSQFVLVNVVVAVLMKKLDESNQTMADDAKIDEDIDRELETVVYDQEYFEKPLLDDQELEFLNNNDIHYFPLKKRLTFIIPFQLSPVAIRNNVKNDIPKFLKCACLLRPTHGRSSVHSNFPNNSTPIAA
ncbi:unnamed protein product [Rotaria sordida]|uniref:Ion transport domain-containing protein n=1 Tax=Rotaria sordida TaxID=392033 RepID=A0A813WHB7_9BILA|nr:unnamed protein product [Rotaria sordida]